MLRAIFLITIGTVLACVDMVELGMILWILAGFQPTKPPKAENPLPAQNKRVAEARRRRELIKGARRKI